MRHVDNPFINPSVISYCTGLRGLERGIERALGPIRTLAIVEIEAFICENLLAGMEAGVLDAAPIWLNLKTFDANPFRGKVHGIIGGYPCFGKGTRILTAEGNKPIEEVTTNDFVLTHQGRWRRVTSIMYRDNADTRIVSGHGVPSTITTDEHPYWVKAQRKYWNNSIRQYRFERSNPSWIEAKDIIPNEGGSLLSQILPDEQYTDEHTSEFWWVVGRYIADGWSQWSPSRRHKKGGRVTICCNFNEAEYLGQKIRAAGFNPYRNKERTTERYCITEHWFYEFVQQFGKGAAGKHLSRTVFELPTDKAKSFIDGYLSGDGSRYKNPKGSRGYEFTTVSMSLALDISLLAQRTHGIVASIKKNNLPPEHKIEGRTVNQKPTWQVRIPDKNKSGFIEGKYGWKLAKRNVPNGTRTVYNISVDEDESYVANGAIVHNCQPFSNAGKRKGADDPRHLWPFICRDIRAARPVWCFFENVAGHLSMGFDQVYRDLAAMDYAVEPGVFTAEEVGAPHERKRLFILAIRKDWLAYARLQRQALGQEQSAGLIKCSEELGDTKCSGLQGEHGRWARLQPAYGHGALGNTSEPGLQECRPSIFGELSKENTGGIHYRPEQSSNEKLATTNSLGYNDGQSKLDPAEGREHAQCDTTTGGEENMVFPCEYHVERQQSGCTNKEKWKVAGERQVRPSDTGDRWPTRPGEAQYDWEAPRTVVTESAAKLLGACSQKYPEGFQSWQVEQVTCDGFTGSVKPEVGVTIDGYNFREDLLRAAGNGVVEQTAELAFIELLNKHFDR